VLGPTLEDAPIALRIVAAAISAVSLAFLFIGLRSALNRIWASPILGVWAYETVPHDESKRADTGYGVAEIKLLARGEISYRVDLYRSAEDAVRALRDEVPVVPSHGTANGLAVSFDETSGALWILYQVEYYSDLDPDREGHLFLRATGPTKQRVLRGSWASDLHGRELSAGTMTMMRPAAFTSWVTENRAA
jgi:hypothetical protein